MNLEIFKNWPRIRGVAGAGLAVVFALLGAACTETEREDACEALSASNRRSEIESCKSGLQHAEVIHHSGGNLTSVLESLTRNGEGTARTCLEGRLRALGTSVTGTQILNELCWCQYNNLDVLFDALENPDSPRSFDRETIRTEMVASCQNGGQAYLEQYMAVSSGRGGAGGAPNGSSGANGAGGMDAGTRYPEPNECVSRPSGGRVCY